MRHIQHIILLFVFISSFDSLLISQISFEISYSTGRNDQARAITQTADSGYVVVGSTVNYNGNTDVYLMKVDQYGTFLWAKRFGGSGVDWGQDIVETTDSGFAIVGFGQQAGNYDMLFIRTDKSGNLLYSKFIGETDWDFGYGLKQTSDKGFILAGESFTSGVSKGYLVKLDSTGTTTWKKTYGGSVKNKFEDVIITAGGGFVMVGETESFGNGKQAYAVRTSSTGGLIWEKNYGNPGIDFAKSVTEIATGEYIITGGTNTPPNSDIDNWAMKINATGNPVQSHTVLDYTSTTPIVENDDWNEVVITFKDSLVFAGKRSFDQAEPGNIYIYRYTHDLVSGNLGGFQKFISAQEEIAYDAKMTKDDGIIFACTGASLDTSASSIYLIKMDSTLQYPHPFYNSLSFQNDYTRLEETPSHTKVVSIYPNPVQNKALIELHGYSNKPVTITVVDTYGKMLYSDVTKKELYEINFSSFKGGIYFVRISTQENVITKKIIVAK